MPLLKLRKMFFVLFQSSFRSLHIQILELYNLKFENVIECPKYERRNTFSVTLEVNIVSK